MQIDMLTALIIDAFWSHCYDNYRWCIWGQVNICNEDNWKQLRTNAAQPTNDCGKLGMCVQLGKADVFRSSTV